MAEDDICGNKARYEKLAANLDSLVKSQEVADKNIIARTLRI